MTGEVFAAFVLLLVGAAAFVTLTWILFTAFSRTFFGTRDSIRLRRARKQLEAIDKLIEKNELNRAVTEIRSAIYLDVPTSRQVVVGLRDHHQNLLSRSLIIAEELNSRLPNLAELEQLFVEYAELQTLHIRSNEAYMNLLSKRERAGKNVPNWSREDYERRLKDVETELNKARKHLREQLDAFFDAIIAGPAQSVTIH